MTARSWRFRRVLQKRALIERPYNLRFRISGSEMQESFDFAILRMLDFVKYLTRAAHEADQRLYNFGIVQSALDAILEFSQSGTSFPCFTVRTA